MSSIESMLNSISKIANSNTRPSVYTPNEISSNNLSCYIGRVISVDDDFINNGILVVDIFKTNDTDTSGPKPGESGSSYRNAKASMTLRLAYKAWKEPPTIKYKGKLVGKGSLSMQNSNVNLTLSTPIPLPPPPAPPVVTIPPGTVIVATGSLSDASTSEVNINTNDLEIELTSDIQSQLPWCSEHGTENFIEPGMKVLCMALGNSDSNLYAVDIFK